MKTNSNHFMRGSGTFGVIISCCLCPTYFHSSIAEPGLSISNVDQQTSGSAIVASDAWIAMPFVTGDNQAGYLLESVQMLSGGASGDPDGFSLSLYATIPGGLIGTPDLNDKLGDLNGLDPISSSLFAYDAGGITLAPATYYYMIATATTPSSAGAFSWNNWTASGRRYDDGWLIPGGVRTSDDGVSWRTTRGQVQQFTIHATAIPEPSTLALLSFGSMFAIARIRRRHRHSCLG